MAASDVMTRASGGASTLATTVLVHLNEVANRTWTLPVVIFFPTSRCNSRCTSCDWWRSSGADDMTLAEIGEVAASLPGLGTRIVAFSGGEPLLRPDVFEAARLFRLEGMRLHLLTSGVLLEGCARDVSRLFDRVVVSLDAPSEDLYHAVRGIPALVAVERGVAALRRLAPTVPVTARATIHRLNFREVVGLIDHAKAMSLDGISFLPADLTSTAFNRTRTPHRESLALDADQIAELEHVIEGAISSRAAEFASGFVAESPDKLRRLPRHYAAMAGACAFPSPSCNAPWMSIVIEADGSVRPCFFHQAIGSVRRTPLSVLVGQRLPEFRKALDMAHDPVCQRCVCALKTGWRGVPWQ